MRRVNLIDVREPLPTGGFAGATSEWQRMRVRVDDGELDVLDEGSGTALVLLHGFPLAKETWDAQAAVLREGARVVRLDLRGLGASRGGPGPYLMESLAGDVVSVLDQLGIQRAAIVGHSLGTYVAYAFFRMFEERVTGLGLVCGRADADAPDVVARRYDFADRAEREGMAFLAEDYVSRFFAPRTYHDHPELVERVRRIALATDPAAAAAMLRGMALRVEAYDLFDAMHVPVTVFAGKEDAIVPLTHQQNIAQGIGGARLVVLDTGHMPHYEAPDALTSALSELLADVAS